MIPTPITFTITNLKSLPGEHQVAGWCFPPTSDASSIMPVWMFVCPGTGEERHYFHLEVEGYEADTYSFAAFYANRGIGVVVIDLPGSGGSRWNCEGSAIPVESMVEANHQAVEQMRERLQQGTLVEQVGPIEHVAIAGIGHSGGGGLCIIQQALHKSFDFLGNFGAACSMPNVSGDPETILNRFPVENGYVTIKLHEEVVPLMYMEDVPPIVRQTYERYLTPVPLSLLSIRQPGILAHHAQSIDIPTLLVFGECDISVAPRQEPHFYTSTRDCTIYEQPGAAHNHNLASTRHEMWTYLYNWLWAVQRASVKKE